MNNNYNSNTVFKQHFAVVKQVDGRAAHMTDTTRRHSWLEQQLHSSHVIKAEEFDFEYVGSKKKGKFQRLNAFLSRSKHLNFVDTLTLEAILDFLIIIIIHLMFALEGNS
jgi:hypothetical protein